MEHSMKLLETPFKKIKSSLKTIEIRLNDEKRKKLKIGDTILFKNLNELNNIIKVKIISLYKYNSFSELIENYGMNYYGYEKNYPVNKFLENIYSIYSKEQELKYGVLGIKIELIKK